MHDAELMIKLSVRKASLNSRFFSLYRFSEFLVKKNTKTFQGMLYRLDEFLFDNIYICRFSRGTVLNLLKQSEINILRGKKDATACSCVLFSS